MPFRPRRKFEGETDEATHKDEKLPDDGSRMLRHSSTTHSLLTESRGLNSMGGSSMASLSHSMSKSDIRATKNRLEAQWRMNRMRQIHDLRRTFIHFCVTENMGTATTAPTEQYDRYQADAGIKLRLSKREVRLHHTHGPR